MKRISILTSVAALVLLVAGTSSAQFPMMSPQGAPGFGPAAGPGGPGLGGPGGYMAGYPMLAGGVHESGMDAWGDEASMPMYGGCDSMGCAALYCDPCGGHRLAVFGDFLYLRPRNAEVPFAVPMDGPIVPPGGPQDTPIQTGPIATLDPDYDTGLRIGFSYALDAHSQLGASYTWFESTHRDGVVIEPPEVVRVLVQHPSQLTAAGDGLEAFGRHNIDFDLIDLDYRYLLSYSPHHQLTGLVGARYARFEQSLRSVYGVLGNNFVNTDITMDGVGVRVGLEGERYSSRRQLFGYLNSSASFIASDFRANYFQGSDFDPTIVDTRYEAGRIVTMLELEAGGGWQSRCKTWRMSAGYLVSGWFNTIQTRDWIHSVQEGSFVDLSSALSFDGLVARVEARF